MSTITTLDKNVRVLVAEDNPINQRVALGLLKKLGYRAQAVATGADVLRALERIHYDIILMDCQLPEIDGFETTRQIRRQADGTGQTGNDHPYIIAMTAFEQTSARTRCTAAGMNDFVSKPIRLDALTQALRRATEKVPAHTSTPEHSQLELLPDQPDNGSIDMKALQTIQELDSASGSGALQEMVSMFFRQAPACLHEIELSLTRYEAQAVALAAHSLKGSASTMGAKRLAEICASIEEEAHQGSLQVAAHLLNLARVEYSKVREDLQSIR